MTCYKDNNSGLLLSRAEQIIMTPNHLRSNVWKDFGWKNQGSQ